MRLPVFFRHSWRNGIPRKLAFFPLNNENPGSCSRGCCFDASFKLWIFNVLTAWHLKWYCCFSFKRQLSKWYKRALLKSRSTEYRFISLYMKYRSAHHWMFYEKGRYWGIGLNNAFLHFFKIHKPQIIRTFYGRTSPKQIFA